jgi:hypothetical protein
MENKETLEEAADLWSIDTDNIHPADSYIAKKGFISGAKWQAKRMYSEEDMKECWYAACAYSIGSHKEFKQTHPNFKEWFEQFKKKQ